MEVLADGTHEGIRWWLQRFDEVPGVAITLAGLDEGRCMIATGNLPDGNLDAVRSWIEGVLAKKRTACRGNARDLLADDMLYAE